VPRDRLGSNKQQIAMFNAMLDKMRAAGATIIDANDTISGYEGLGEAEYFVLLTELKSDMEAYLKSLPEGLVEHKTLADLIAFNKANADKELQHFGQEIFDQAQATGGTDDPGYAAARAKSLDLAGRKGIDGLLSLYNADIIVQLSNGPAWLSTLGKGDSFVGPSASNWAAVAGYPHVTVPMGYINELPVGISFIGRKWHDHNVIKAAYAYEQLTKARKAPSYKASVSE
jgi:amidase